MRFLYIFLNYRGVEPMGSETNFNFIFENNVKEPIDLSMKPLLVLKDCFAQGTTPNFLFSKHVSENNYVRSCKWRPDGSYLCVESQDRYVRLFKFEDNQLKQASYVRSGDLFYDVQWHPTSNLFATTSKNHPIHLWDSNGKLCLSFRGINHLDELASAYSIAFSLTGDTLYAGYYKTIRIFNLERPGRQLKDIKTFEKCGITNGQKGILPCIVSCPTISGVYAVGCFNGIVGLYSDYTDKCDCLFSTGAVGITHIQYSSDGNLLFCGYRKNSIIECFDLRFPGHVLSTFYRPAETSQKFYYQLDRTDRYLFSGSSTGKILIYDLKQSKPNSIKEEIVQPHWFFQGNCSAVTGLSIHPFLPIIATTSGQRVFPNPLDSDSDSNEDETKNEAKDYQLFKRNQLDNTLKLWKF